MCFQRLYLFGLLLFSLNCVSAQPIVQAWGNLTGIRVDGQLLRIESSYCLVEKGWHWEHRTGQERNPTRFHRMGSSQIVHTNMDSLFIVQTVQGQRPGTAQIAVEAQLRDTMEFEGVFFHLNLPEAQFADAEIQLAETVPLQWNARQKIPNGKNELLRAYASSIFVKSATRNLQIKATESGLIIVKSDTRTGDLGLYFELMGPAPPVGTQVRRLFDISIEGTGSVEPTEIKLFPQYPGNAFLGLGGNFRLQNAKTDPQVIDYCLNNLEVRMGRVELPWSFWHPVDTINPLTTARLDSLHPRVKASMEMAKRLYDMDMPVLLAAWFPPQWAAKGIVKRNPRNPDGTYGNPLREDRMEEIYRSITAYIIYLKEVYDVEISMFSFNESDLGINVRQTAEEHAELIKGLGAYMKSKGLKTKLLLGDTADGNGFDFANEALDDPETWEFIGAVSFHSWRGWKKETLLEWYEAADRLNVPLLIGEGSIDAAAWRYPGIFEEPHYALEEIKLYVRIMAICQPQSILQWQLTADYSPLSGAGIFGKDDVPLQETQRFWNLRQLSQTPVDLHFLPTTCTNDDLYVVALGDRKQKNVAFHIVNEGAEQEVVLTGIPEKVKRFQLFITDEKRAMIKGQQIEVKEGTALFRIGPACFVSLFKN